MLVNFRTFMLHMCRFVQCVTRLWATFGDLRYSSRAQQLVVSILSEQLPKAHGMYIFIYADLCMYKKGVNSTV